MARFLLVLVPVSLVLILLIFFGAGFFNDRIGGFTSLTISGKAVAVANFLNGLKRNQDVSKLTEERDRLIGKLAQLEELKRENDDLRRALNLPPSVKRSLSDAGIYSITQTPAGQVALINKGSNDGISINDVVISSSGILVGRIKEVFEAYSGVELSSDPLFKATARVLGSNTAGIVQGMIGGDIRLDFVSQTDQISVGDKIVTSGNDLYPPGLIIGTVKSVKLDPGSLFKHIVVEPEFKNLNLARVLISIQ